MPVSSNEPGHMTDYPAAGYRRRGTEHRRGTSRYQAPTTPLRPYMASAQRMQQLQADVQAAARCSGAVQQQLLANQAMAAPAPPPPIMKENLYVMSSAGGQNYAYEQSQIMSVTKNLSDNIQLLQHNVAQLMNRCQEQDRRIAELEASQARHSPPQTTTPPPPTATPPPAVCDMSIEPSADPLSVLTDVATAAAPAQAPTPQVQPQGSWPTPYPTAAAPAAAPVQMAQVQASWQPQATCARAHYTAQAYLPPPSAPMTQHPAVMVPTQLPPHLVQPPQNLPYPVAHVQLLSVPPTSMAPAPAPAPAAARLVSNSASPPHAQPNQLTVSQIQAYWGGANR